VISAAALLGLSEETGTLADGEPLAAHIVRDLAYAAGSTWRRLVTDPVTGEAIELTSTSYAPHHRGSAKPSTSGTEPAAPQGAPSRRSGATWTMTCPGTRAEPHPQPTSRPSPDAPTATRPEANGQRRRPRTGPSCGPPAPDGNTRPTRTSTTPPHPGGRPPPAAPWHPTATPSGPGGQRRIVRRRRPGRVRGGCPSTTAPKARRPRLDPRLDAAGLATRLGTRGRHSASHRARHPRSLTRHAPTPTHRRSGRAQPHRRLWRAPAAAYAAVRPLRRSWCPRRGPPPADPADGRCARP
jgi:hypothetical protein